MCDPKIVVRCMQSEILVCVAAALFCSWRQYSITVLTELYRRPAELEYVLVPKRMIAFWDRQKKEYKRNIKNCKIQDTSRLGELTVCFRHNVIVGLLSI